MNNITDIIFRRITSDFIITSDIGCTYNALVETALDNIKWATDTLAENPKSTYAKETRAAAIESIKTATVMLLRVAYPHKVDIYTAASKVVDIKCKRLGIKRYF